MLIERIEIRLLDLPLVEPFAAAHGTTTSRDLVVVRVDGEAGTGWGECAALPEPTYNDEFAAGAFTILDEELAPRLLGLGLGAADVSHRLGVVAGNPMAKAALEMALLDAELRSRGVSLASYLGANVEVVSSGAAVGLGPVDAVVERVASLDAEGYRRVKLKIQPGHDRDVVAAVIDRVPSIELQVDGNGSFGAGHLDLLIEVAGLGVTAIEQPFPPADIGQAAALADAVDAAVVADEAATSIQEVARLHEAGAIDAVSIKPSRLGGLRQAVTLHDRCRELGLAAAAGGMVESGLGRHALVALAALPGFTLTGDLSPAGRWLAVDPWPDLTMAGGVISVPRGPGVAPAPDPDLLDANTVTSTELRLH